LKGWLIEDKGGIINWRANAVNESSRAATPIDRRDALSPRLAACTEKYWGELRRAFYEVHWHPARDRQDAALLSATRGRMNAVADGS